MGKVYLAEDTSLGRKVAVKFLSSNKAADPESRKRFVHEARAQAMLSHPNIATFHEVGEEGDRVFIVMEYIEGQPLSRLVSSEKFSLPEIPDLAIQVGEGLQAAHEKGVVHRDIKPENVLVTSKHHAKITDFGLAKWKGASTLTQTGARIGTAYYMSPEQVEGKKVDHRTDIFSLGIVLYELLCARRPFEGDTETAVFYDLINNHPQPLARYARNLPEKLEQIVMKCLAKKPEERYQSAADLVADLKMLKRTSEIRVSLTYPEKTKSKRWLTVGLATGGLALIAMTGFHFLADKSEAIDSVAVLPFVNVNANPDVEYLADGITENIINSLSSIPRLKVVPRSTVFRYKGNQVDPQEVGAKLGVGAVLAGRVVQHGENLNIQVDLVDIGKRSQIWGEQYNRKLSDILVLQEEIIREIPRKLQIGLSESDREQLTKRYTENTAAYQLYLKGRYYFDKRTSEGVKKSIEYFLQAIERDSNYALAYAGLANSYNPQDIKLPPREAYTMTKTAVIRALEIDDRLAEAHTAMARFLQNYEWDWAGAEKELKRAIELNPSGSEAHHIYAHHLVNVGRIEESLLESRKALELDSLDVLLNLHSGWNFLYARQFDQAIKKLQETAQMDPNFFRIYVYLGRAYVGKGVYDEALKAFQKAIELEAGGSEAEVMLGYCYAVSGRRPEATRILEKFKGLYEQNRASAYELAVIYAGLGGKSLALDWLEKAVAERSGSLMLLKVEPIFDGIRADVKFTELLKKVGLEK